MTQVTTEQAIQIAIQHHRAGRLPDAERIYRQILANQPDHADALNLLGVIAEQVGQSAAAVELIRKSMRANPNLAEAHHNLGNSLKSIGHLEEAIASYRRAIQLKPDFAESYNNLGNALTEAGQLDEAIAALQHGIQISPELALAHHNLGDLFRSHAKLDQAIESYHRAISIRPDLAESYNNLGDALKDMGRLDEALAWFRRAIQVRPDFAGAHSNLLYSLHFHPDYDAEKIHAEHRKWNQQHADPLKKFIRPHPNDTALNRKLRIGYVSADFREHPVGRFLLPILSAHDHDRFTVYCYCDVSHHDSFTDLLHSQASHWRNIFRQGDAQVEQLIRQDQIDILVDLGMHTAGNRMLLFARKPAPVQMTYLAYCSTTGLDAIDYRLTDRYLDPPESTDAFYSERSIRLPLSYWCYPVPNQAPEILPPPALATGRVMFGCLNNFCKVSSVALHLWIELLHRVPHSDLMLHTYEGTHRQRLADLFAQNAIDRARLVFVGKLPPAQYFATYEQIDIALDPFPCNGGTTTCDALWMGVPVITLVGITAVGRAGASVLNNAGLPEFIAKTRTDYVEIAFALAADLPRLTMLRRTLRPRMQSSPLMDAPKMVRSIEAAYQIAWNNRIETAPKFRTDLH